MKHQQLSLCELTQNQVSSPLGPWNVIACEAGLHSVKLSEEVTNENFLTLGCKSVKLKRITDNKHIKNFESWMEQYFCNKVVNHYKIHQSFVKKSCLQKKIHKPNIGRKYG